MRSRWYFLAVAVGSGIAFLSEYEPFTDAVRSYLRAAVDDVVSTVQYEAAVQRTLDSIRQLPETKEAE